MKLKKVISILTAVVIIGIAVFVVGLIFADSDSTRWRIFSVVIPIVGISFWGAVILSVIDYLNSKK